MHPPWILLYCLLSYTTTPSSGSSETEADARNATRRSQREISDRERRLIPYMTFYLGGYGNPGSAERQNVLIPIQSTQQEPLDQFGGVQQVQPVHNNNIQQYQILPRAVLVRLQEAGLIRAPNNQNAQTATEYQLTPAANQLLYGFRSPGPQPQTYHHHRPQQTHHKAPQKPLPPHVIKLVPVRPNHAYTSTKLQSFVPNAYLNEYYKSQAEAQYAPHKLYSSLDPVPRVQKQRFRNEKVKYTASKIYASTTTPSPYTNQVKFELEDARVPTFVNSIRLHQIKPTPPPYVQTQNSGLSGYLETVRPHHQPQQHQQQQQPQHVYYTQEINEDPHNQIGMIPQVHHVPQQVVEVTEPDPVHRVPQVPQIPQAPVKQIHYVQQDDNDIASVPDPNSEHVVDILKQTNQLPQNFTPDNIDGSMKTLTLILQSLHDHDAKSPRVKPPVKPKPPKPPKPTIPPEFHEHKPNEQSYPQPSGSSTPGRAGIDYPIYSTIPHTTFDCSTQRYKGFFGDPDTHCQVWHYCDLNGGQASFLCPNGTVFSQVALTCDWWFNVRCASTSQLYVLNERLYKYILPFSPSFPEDYSGPVVDRYLAAKFKEMEAKSRIKALKALISTPKPDSSTPSTPTTMPETTESLDGETH